MEPGPLTIAAFAVCLLLAGPVATQSRLEPDAHEATAAETIEASLPRLRALVMEGIERTEPSANIWKPRKRQTVFDGSYDWHSCISAHWAALCMARVTHDHELEARVLARLTPQVLARERALFAEIDAPQPEPDPAAAKPENPTPRPRTGGARAFFMPFADAWMLLLLAELSKHDGRDDADLRAFRIETEDRVLRALESMPFPDGPANRKFPEVVFGGSYRSFLFAALALRLAGTIERSAGDRLAAIEKDKIAPERERLARDDAHLPSDFLDVRAIDALLERLQPDRTHPVDYAGPPLPLDLPKSVAIRDCHVLGRILTSLWPMAWDGQRDPAVRAAFEQRTATFLARTDLWDGDFGATQHWVPQYIWLGLWLARGRD